MIKIGIYKIENVLNNKVYIGSSFDIYHRWARHRGTLERGTHTNRHLQAAYNLDGTNSFEYEIVEETPKDKFIVKERETHWITFYDSANPDKGYNILPISHSGVGFKHTEEAKELIRKSRLGKHLTKQAKQKVRDFLTGHEVSQETRDKISEANKGKTAWNKGLQTGPLPKSQKKAIGKGNKGKRTGIFVSEETRRKLSESHKGQIPWQHKNNP